MTANDQAASNAYQLVQIPTSLGVAVDVEAGSIDEVRAWALSNVDTSTRWIVKHNGRNVGEAIVVERYRCLSTCSRATKRVFNTARPRAGWFDAAEDAVADYRSRLPEANRRLDDIVRRVADLQAELGFDLSYTMSGDTHGIYEDYQYVSVTIDDYVYERRLDD